MLGFGVSMKEFLMIILMHSPSIESNFWRKTGHLSLFFHIKSRKINFRIVEYFSENREVDYMIKNMFRRLKKLFKYQKSTICLLFHRNQTLTRRQSISVGYVSANASIDYLRLEYEDPVLWDVQVLSTLSHHNAPK